jgi:flotillin
MTAVIALVVFIVAVFFGALMFMASRIKVCPTDRILVIYGNGSRGSEGSAKLIQGGRGIVFPVIQGYAWLDLTPLAIDIQLQGALSQQNIRVNTPATFTVAVSKQPGVRENAAERLLNKSNEEIQELARDIIFGQMRVVIATMPIEEINADREKLIANITDSLEVELRKVGLELINVNIQDITDESGYIDALGREAAARAINDAKVRVAEQERDGDIGSAEANREQRIRVAEANATATEGENSAKVTVANSDSLRRQQEAEAERLAIAAERVSQARAAEESYSAEEESERRRAERERATEYANVVVPAEIERERIQTLAEGEAEKVRRLKQGEADGLRAVMEAEAAGYLASLTQRAEGLGSMMEKAGGSAELAALMMIVDQMPKLVEEQVKAISNLQIDNITVWDSGSGDSKGGQTANFLSSLMGSLPPMHELAANVGIRLPEFLGEVDEGEAMAPKLRKLADKMDEAEASGEPEAPQPDWEG